MAFSGSFWRSVTKSSTLFENVQNVLSTAKFRSFTSFIRAVVLEWTLVGHWRGEFGTYCGHCYCSPIVFDASDINTKS